MGHERTRAHRQADRDCSGELAAELRSRAGRGNVSAYVTDALIRQLEHDRLGDLLDELAETHGVVSDEELARARAEWPER